MVFLSLLFSPLAHPSLDESIFLFDPNGLYIFGGLVLSWAGLANYCFINHPLTPFFSCPTVEWRGGCCFWYLPVVETRCLAGFVGAGSVERAGFLRSRRKMGRGRGSVSWEW